jgi:signal transduction histidine kinase
MGWARNRLARSGLRWRLVAWVAVVTAVCIGIAFVAVYRGTGTQLRHEIDTEIAGDSAEFADNLEVARVASPKAVARAAKSYVDDQPFSASSTLLFAIVAGEPPSTNRPELFGHPAPDNGETVAEQDAEDRLSARLLTVPDGYSTLTLPDVGNLRLLKRSLSIAGGLRVTVGVGEPLAPVVHAQRGVARAFILPGILALLGTLLGAYLIGTRVSRPLQRFAAVAARVDSGDLRPRVNDPGIGGEVRILAHAFNRMLDRLSDAFAGQRAFVADASHELRTPLTVIRGQLEVLAAEPDPSREEVARVNGLVQAEIARIGRLVDDLLLLAKAEQTQFLRVEPVDVAVFVGDLWDGMSLLADRRFELSEVPQGRLIVDPDRLAQALRNLLANAIEHTIPDRGLVRLSVEPAAGGRIRFVIEDDGPGIPAEERERVFDRFHRTDAARDRASGGTGLGLAIVRAIAEAHGGVVLAGRSAEGGARIALELPHFTVAGRAARTGHAGSRSPAPS